MNHVEQEVAGSFDSNTCHEDFERNFWEAPDYYHLGLVQKIRFLANGYGGEFDQSHFYIDTKCAERWLALSTTREYQVHLGAQQTTPLNQVAQSIYNHWQTSNLNKKKIKFLALGAGDGSKEIYLVQNLLQYAPQTQVHLYFLDISPFLLNVAYHNAIKAFSKDPGVQVIGLQANFENLSTYKPIIQLAKSSDCPILISLLGYSFGSLTNERVFVRNALRVFGSNAFFLVDGIPALAPPDQPEEIWKREPRLAGQAPWHETEEGANFVMGPLQQYRDHLRNIHIYHELDYSTCFDGSYAVEVRALVDDEISFMMFRLKRYLPEKLEKVFRQEGWHQEETFRFGPNNHPKLIVLFKKKSNPDESLLIK